MLDGVVQLTEKDEYIYHEMLVHPAMFAHGDVNDVLIIGGGDGGAAREVLKHKDVNVVQVEIDEKVVKFCNEYLPKISMGAYDDPRHSLEICDGAQFIKETDKKFDIIIVDATDPIGPAKVLFEDQFYANCKKVLKEEGILVTQNGVPFFQGDELKNTVSSFKRLFKHATCYLANVPTYVGGPLAFGWGTDNMNTKLNMPTVLSTRLKKSDLDLKFYNEEVHRAAFALPNDIKVLID